MEYIDVIDQIKIDETNSDMLASKLEANLNVNNIENNKEVTENSKNGNDVTNKTENIVPEKSQETKVKSVPVKTYVYKDDQWSPNNLQGKKQYDVDFLYKLRDDPQSWQKPETLTVNEILAERTPRAHGTGEPRNFANIRPNHDLLPTFAKGSRNVPPRRSQGKPSMRNIVSSVGSPRPMIHVSLSLRDDVKLNETENAWKPSRMRSSNVEDQERETQELYKKFRSVLNKLTPQKFDTLMAQVRELKIDTDERLSGVINLVFEKALDEPNFSVTYALMCKELEQIKVKAVINDQKEEKVVSFRSLIVSRCQKEFEKEDNQTAEKQKEVDECTDLEKKKELQLILEEEERKVRMRSVGNVRFIGELFKQDIITAKIMVYCIRRLLFKVEEETLECLCKLLSTIGKNLESVYKIDLAPYFKEMQALVNNTGPKKVCSRVRFMLQDVIELRQKQWVPRKIVANSNPKTIDQIQMEADLEQLTTYQNNASSSPNVSKRDDRPSNMNKRGGSKSVTEEGWSQAPSRNSRTLKYSVDPEKLSKMADSTPIKQTSLQPSSFMSWGGGANTSKKESSPRYNNSNNSYSNNKKNMTNTASNNMYNLLQDNTPENIPPTNSGSYKGKSSANKENRFIDDSNKGALSLDMYGDDIPRKIHAMMDQLQDEKVYGLLDKIQCNLLQADVPASTVVKELIIWGIQFNQVKNMQTIGEVTGRLVDDQALTTDQFLEVFKKTMDTSFDLLLEGDENVWDVLAAFIWGHMLKDPLTLRQIHTTIGKIIDVGKGYEFLVSFFKAKLRDQKNSVASLWENGKMELTDWFSEKKIEDFLKAVPHQCFGQQLIVNPEVFYTQLTELLENKTPVDDVNTWIKARIGDVNCKEGWFIRSLTEAICTFTLCPTSSKPRFDIEAKQRLAMYYQLLVTYVGNEPKLELHCLFAIQRLMHKLEHPIGITVPLFEYLWESGEAISMNGFLAWETNTDPLEQEGKGVMLMTLTSFFTALKSCDESSDDTTSIVDDLSLN